MLFYIKRYNMKKEKFKQKFIEKHTKKPFIYKSESGRIICSINYEEKYKKLQKLVRKYLKLDEEK